MSYKLVVGSGKGHSYSTELGTKLAHLTVKDKNKTIFQLAKLLLKEAKIKNGEIEIIGIQFTTMEGK
jgi:hypothetical protein